MNCSNYISYAGTTASGFGADSLVVAQNPEQERANRLEINALEEKANKLLTELNELLRSRPTNSYSREYDAKRAEFDAISSQIVKLLNTTSEYTVEDYKAVKRHTSNLGSQLWGYRGADREIKEREQQAAWDLYFKIQKALKLEPKTDLKDIVQTVVITSPLWLGTAVAALSAKNHKLAAGVAGAAIGLVTGIPMLAVAYVSGLTPIAIGIPLMVAASYGAGKAIG